MTPEHSRKLIAAAGGNKAFCLRLGFDYDMATAKRVDNWRSRGIPATVQLLKRNELARLERSAKRRGVM